MALPLPSHAFLFLLLAAHVRGYVTFETVCSTPSRVVNFVSSPDVRGTLDILWSSLFTILACTWTIQHPNIPEQRNGRDPGWRGDLTWQLRGFLEKAKLMLFTMVAPEIIISAAMHDLMAAHNTSRKMKTYVSEDEVPWSLLHSYYANMGGFVIQSRVSKAVGTAPYVRGYEGDDRNDADKTKTSSSSPEPPSNEALRSRRELPYHDPFHLTGSQLYELRHNKIIPRLPYITTEDLKDKSKGDALVKAIAVVQISWSTVQTIARAVRGLAISQLELSVVAFAASAVVVYGLYWSKPKSIHATTTVIQYEHQIPEFAWMKPDPDAIGFVREILNLPFNALPGLRPKTARYSSPECLGSFWVVFALFLAAALFGSIHVAAWKFDFPTTVELIAWRAASLYATAWGPFCLLGSLITASYGGGKAMDISAALAAILYVFARLFLVVEIFRALCFPPQGVFIGTWASNVPHVA